MVCVCVCGHSFMICFISFTLVLWWFGMFLFWRRSLTVGIAGLELPVILLPLLPEFWEYQQRYFSLETLRNKSSTSDVYETLSCSKG